jgi:hypothetical protein
MRKRQKAARMRGTTGGCMEKRVLLAGILGGIAMFAWSSIAHMVLPLGMTGVSEIPNENAVLSAMQTSLGGRSGLYLFPGMGLGPNPTMKDVNAAMPQYEKKLASNSHGLLIYHPPGGKAMEPRQLLTEFATEVVEALLSAWLLSRTRLASYAARVGFVFVVGLTAAISTNISYWNWYGFPGSYTAAYVSMQIVGFLVAGLVAAAVLKRPMWEAMAAGR